MNTIGLTGELAQQVLPWSVLISTALLAWAVGAIDRRFPNPIVLSLWLLGISMAAWLGRWGAAEVNLGLVFLALPHVSQAVLTRRRTDRETDEVQNTDDGSASVAGSLPGATDLGETDENETQREAA